MANITKENLIKINEVTWEIPKNFRSDMRVPARVFATEEMIEDILNDRSLWQIVNVATLPGISRYALAMPDIHEGYGFPVGGVAAMSPKDGVISPGGIGYDINCLHPDTELLLTFGTTLKIKELLDNNQRNLLLLKKRQKQLHEATMINWFSRQENDYLHFLKSKFGFSIRVTGDHPIYNGKWMQKAENIKCGDKVIIYPFSGVKYQTPDSTSLISEEKIMKAFSDLELPNRGNRYAQIMNWVRKNKFSEFRLDSRRTPYLIKALGLLLGDGTINFVGKAKKGHVAFYGKEEDLKELQDDLIKIGVSAKIYKRQRDHVMKSRYGKIYKFSTTEYSLRTSSTSFALILYLLGAPLGNKTYSEFSIPSWLANAPLWHQRLFLAAFFGAEMSKPQTLNKYNFYNPTLNLNKSIPFKENGKKFMEELRMMLGHFGVRSSEVVEVEGLSSNGKTIGLRLQIYGDSENLIKFFGTVNFEYNREKKYLANLAIAYLKYKEKIIRQRRRLRALVRSLYKTGIPSRTLIKGYGGQYVEPQYIEHSLWSVGREEPRISLSFPSFEEFVQIHHYGNEGLVVDEIEGIERESYQGPVYDLTVNHPDHNFIANNIVVSNCGVRLLYSDLTFKEAEPHLDKLADNLFREVPSGVGRGGQLKLNDHELDLVLEKGAERLVEVGYGKKEDLERLESSGRLEDADPSRVSEHAKSRGRDQLGTMGAGNHFVEVGRVEKIFDKEWAEKFELFENQVTILVHTGSRGLGHQIATDYIRLMMRVMAKYGISLPDRELASAPFSSKEGQDYFSAMKCGANFAWANRQLITWEVRESWKKAGLPGELAILYDVAHNIAKVEEYDGEELVVHRKGATRAFPGQAVLIPGSMGTSSYVLVGLEGSIKNTFGTTCHGAGREMSRAQARRQIQGKPLKEKLEHEGIRIRAGSWSGLAEEAPEAYKNVDEVVEVVEKAGIAKRVARLKPIAVVKG